MVEQGMLGFWGDDRGSFKREEGFKPEQIPVPIHSTATDGARLGRNHMGDDPCAVELKQC